MYIYSNFYEQLVEHVFVSEILQEAWFSFREIIEVLHSEIDNSGYDLVLECRGISRHVQLKTSDSKSKTTYQKVNIALANKPCGCVIWLVREDEDNNNRIKLRYKFFGGNPPGNAMPSLESFKVGKHTKGDASGIKKERHSIRLVPKTKFIDVPTCKQLLHLLFGLD